jgi:hypothetical protein
MIDEKVFRDSWALLCERFGKEPSLPLMTAYYKAISPQLSTAQFEAACDRIFMEREFFPRPADFLAEVRPDPKADALEQWEQVQELMRGETADLDPTAKRVVRALGGTAKLRNTSLDAVQYVRRDFMALYADLSTNHDTARIEPTAEGLRLTARIMDEAG